MKLLAFILFMIIPARMIAQRKSVNLLPDHLKVQFAGSIGYISAGAGYKFSKDKFQADLFYGYVPQKFAGGEALHSTTAKFTWQPFRKWNSGSVLINPFSAGAYANYTFGKDYFLFNPDKYPLSYYGYPTALHMGAFIGGSINIDSDQKKIPSLGLYYELGTTDFELASYFTNRSSLSVTDILNLGIGLSYQF